MLLQGLHVNPNIIPSMRLFKKPSYSRETDGSKVFLQPYGSHSSEVSKIVRIQSPVFATHVVFEKLAGGEGEGAEVIPESCFHPSHTFRPWVLAWDTPCTGVGVVGSRGSLSYVVVWG